MKVHVPLVLLCLGLYLAASVTESSAQDQGNVTDASSDNSVNAASGSGSTQNPAGTSSATSQAGGTNAPPGGNGGDNGANSIAFGPLYKLISTLVTSALIYISF